MLILIAVSESNRLLGSIWLEPLDCKITRHYPCSLWQYTARSRTVTINPLQPLQGVCSVTFYSTIHIRTKRAKDAARKYRVPMPYFPVILMLMPERRLAKEELTGRGMHVNLQLFNSSPLLLLPLPIRFKILPPVIDILLSRYRFAIKIQFTL